jgi:putative transposase
MGQSLVKNHIHLIFSTKNRVPLIDEVIEIRLHEYLGGICKNLGCQPIQVGGYVDHVHIMCMLSQKLALMKLMELLKSHSSKWIKEQGDRYRQFYWQDGYAAFSVSRSQVEAVVKYIANQKAHHARIAYQQELLTMLEAHGMDYDPRYIWV